MREIVLDTETTGFDPFSGDRIVEIGCVELVNQMPTGRTYHQYINPERDMPDGAFKVHGLSEEFLRDFPVFSEIADAFLEFVGDAGFVIHNAEFDMKFLNHEMKQIGKPEFEPGRATDTLLIARRKFPNGANSLDALCKRFGVDNSSRTLHGALLDSEILAEVYLELIGGRQRGLLEESASSKTSTDEKAPTSSHYSAGIARQRPRPLPNRITPEERSAHTNFIDEMGDRALWRMG